MTKEKQIEEMAEILWEYSRTRDDDAIALGESLAEYLIDKGYCKASEVAEDIIRMLRAAGINEFRYPIVAEIKKKYIQSEDK